MRGGKRLKKRTAETTPSVIRWGLLALGGLGMGLATALLVLWLNFETFAALAGWILQAPAYLALTVLVYAALIWALSILVGRLWLGGGIVGAAALVVALVNGCQRDINGMPLSLADFGLITGVGEVVVVAGELQIPWEFCAAFSAMLLLSALMFRFRRWMALRGIVWLAGLVSSLLVLTLVWMPPGSEWLGSAFGVDLSTRLDPAGNQAQYGMTLALWRDVVMQNLEEPEVYGEASMEAVLARIDEILIEEEPAPAKAPAETPNVIFILSESFFDLTKLPGLTYDSDPLENFHRLEKESVRGDFFTHYLGYGTGYLEMSMQYGITHRDFAPGTNICFMEDETYQYFDSLAEQFTNTGHYRAEMLHAYNDSLYNRTVTYPGMGYSDLYFSADVQELGLEWQGGMYGGYYLKDAYFFDGILRRMEEINAGGQRAFLYGITMENHQPFDPEKFDYECQIGVESRILSEENMEIVRVMLEGITRADQALGRLTDALQQSEEPTVLVFFGDHRPNLFMTDGDTVYTKLGLCPSNDTVDWSPEEIGELYSTDYLIWANDAARGCGIIPGEADSSIAAIGPQLLELLDWPVSRYWGLMQKVGEVALVNTELFFVTGDSRPFLTPEDALLTEEARELLALREQVLYDAYYGEKYITAAMNAPPGT